MTKEEFINQLTEVLADRIEMLPDEMLNIKSFILAIGVLADDKVFSTSIMQKVPPPVILEQLIFKMERDLKSHFVKSCELHSEKSTTINNSNSNNLIN